MRPVAGRREQAFVSTLESKPESAKNRELARTECLSRAIDAIGQGEFLPALLDYLRVDVPYVGILLLLLDEKNRPFHIYDTIRTPYRINLDMYLDGVYQLDPFYTYFCKHRKTDALLIRDIAPDRFNQTEYYRRYYKNIELQDEMAIFTDLHDGRFLFFSIGRRADELRFRRRDIKAMRRDLPVVSALCRQHFGESSYNQESLAGNVDEKRLQYALERFGESALTPREHEVAVCILKGHSSKSLAREIDISPETVKIHRRNLYRKLGISSQSELFLKFLNTLG
ncbi:MAG: LuxR family transcriptional regulator [Gammaproteobacteria bacterium]|nr:MAG: LuxR family transcriptional regulator [Gammaproteobacteria bacterium]